MDFKTIFGEEALTLAQFQEKTKGMKLVDLTAGEFVDKRKFDSEHAELVKAKDTIKALEANKGDTNVSGRAADLIAQYRANRYGI